MLRPGGHHSGPSPRGGGRLTKHHVDLQIYNACHHRWGLFLNIAGDGRG